MRLAKRCMSLVLPKRFRSTCSSRMALYCRRFCVCDGPIMKSQNSFEVAATISRRGFSAADDLPVQGALNIVATFLNADKNGCERDLKCTSKM